MSDVREVELEIRGTFIRGQRSSFRILDRRSGHEVLSFSGDAGLTPHAAMTLRAFLHNMVDESLDRLIDPDTET